jgi:glycosyltransferase involved in cell wall biosynthesis
MIIGVIFHGSMLAGGSFQQAISTIRTLSEEDTTHKYIFYSPSHTNIQHVKSYGITTKVFKFGRKERFIHKLRKLGKLNCYFDRFHIFQPIDKNFENDKVDLIYFAGPDPICLFLERINYVFTVWDLCHRDHVEFPEVRHSFEFEARENLLQMALPKAVAVIAESPLGKRNIIRRYGIDEKRVEWIPLSPADRELNKNDPNFDPFTAAKIPHKSPYIFYPAQFWAHKNHKIIIDAVAFLRETKKIDIYAVFCGSDCGILSFVLEMAKQRGVSDLIKYMGFVPDEHMNSYYTESLALIMPSFFGPTNMPPLEAFSLGVPVVVSDLPGIREQVGDAAMLIAPDKPKELAKVIMKLLVDSKLRENLITRGKSRLKELSNPIKLAKLNKIFDDYKIKAQTWSLLEEH